MTPLVKALLAVALVVPLVAYVAGSLASTGGETPEQQGTVFIDDVEPASETTSPPGARQGHHQPTRPRASPARRDDPDDKLARVVTPAPVEDDDDERDGDQDDDTDDGDDTDD